MPILYNILTILIALALSLTFFGKAIIGVTLSLAIFVSLTIIWQGRHIVFPQGNCTIAHFLSKEKIAIILMLAAWMISAIQGVDSDKSIKEVFEFSGMIMGGIIIFTAVNTREFSLDRLMRWAVLSAGFCAAYMALTPFIIDFVPEWRSSYGAVLTIIMPMAMYMIFKRPRQSRYWLCLSLIILGIFASGSRTALVALMIISMLFPFLYIWHGVHRPKLKIGLVALVIIITSSIGFAINKRVIGEDH